MEKISFLISKGAKFVKGDVLDFEKLLENSKNFDVVIHLAAKSDVAESVIFPEDTINVNVNGTINVLKCCVQNKIQKIIFASSAAVYGNHENIISEKLSTNLKDAKGMRNIIAHDYGKIDDELVFESLKEQLIPDTEEFIKSIRESL